MNWNTAEREVGDIYGMKGKTRRIGMALMKWVCFDGNYYFFVLCMYRGVS